MTIPVTNPLKAISKTDTELRVRNAIILFGGRDLEFVRSGANPDKSLGTFFSPNIDVGQPHEHLPVGWEHGDNPDEMPVNAKAFGDLGYVDWKTVEKNEKGIFVDRVLNRRHKYVQFVEQLINDGLIGTSSEADPKSIRALDNGEIVSWHLIGDTLTVSPVEPRMLKEFGANTLKAIKALQELDPEIPALKSLSLNVESPEGEGAPISGPANSCSIPKKPEKSIKKENPMKLMDIIKNLVPGLTDEQYAQIESILTLKGVIEAAPAGAEPNADDTDPTATAEDLGMRGNLNVPDVAKALGEALIELGFQPTTPAPATQPAPTAPARGKAITRPTFDFKAAQRTTQPQEDPGKKALEAVYVTRFGDEDAATQQIMRDYIGADYKSIIAFQNKAFAKYLRYGTDGLNREEVRSLKSLYFPKEVVLQNVKAGIEVRSVKSTQMEAVGELGGYAVPPNSQSEIARRSVGLTAVRGNGARVIQLINSNGIEIPVYRSTSKTKIGQFTGQWGTETQAPAEQNFKMDLELLMAHIYTYKVPMSVSLLEDAANLVSLVEEDIASTKAIDEDVCFLVADGVGKPRGILPGGVNTDSLTEVVSGSAAALTAAGINKLKRGLPAQYRDPSRTVWVLNSSSISALEEMTVGGGNLTYAFPEIQEENKIRRFNIAETEAMPDVAANSYPVAFCNMPGYTIVERLGMTVERFKDSGTGPNKVEFHVRARVGGRVEKPWMFAVQKVAA